MTRLASWWLGIIVFAVGTWAPMAAAGPVVTAQPCTTDEDMCAPPLACRPGMRTTCSQSGSQPVDGGATLNDPVCVTDPPACTWVLTACQTDDSCTQPRWTCMLLQGAQPITHICFPQGIDCSAGAACPLAWSCVDFSTVKERDLAEMWMSTGSTKFCWPDVLAGVLDKTTPVDPSQLDITGVEGGGTEGTPRGVVDGSSSVVDGGMALLGSDASSPAPTSSPPTASAPSSGKSSGCSMLGRGHAAGLLLPFACALALLAGRRRSRAVR